VGVGALVVVSSVVVSDVVSEVVSEDSVVSEVSSVVASVVVSVVVSFACVETEGRLVAAGCALQPAMPAVIASINIMLIVVLNFFIFLSVISNCSFVQIHSAKVFPAGYNYTPVAFRTVSHL